jgi:phage tail protein X
VARVLAAAACLAALAGCSGESSLVDDRNPFYVKGLRLRQENRYTDAAEAFEKCLRLSPASAKAHLQLAMLYEDRLSDPVRAIYHYRAYLATSPNGENADMVRKWLVRAERSYLQKLMRQYPDDVEVLTNNGAPPGVPVGVTPREIQLGRRLKDVSLQLNQARDELRRVPGGATAGREGATGAPPSADGPSRPAGGTTDFSPGTPGPDAGGEPGLPVGDGPPIEAASGEVPPVPVVAAPKPLVPEAVAVVEPTPPPAAPVTPVAVPAAASRSASPAAPAPARPATAGTPAAGRPFKPLWRLTPGSRLAPTTPASSGAAAPGSSVRGGAAARHTVQTGETLSGLARKYYGRAGAWTRIRDANPELRAGGALRPGMKVVIP